MAGIVLLLMVLPGGGRAAAADAPGKVRVQYVSSGSVYLDAGQAAGLAEGTRLRVEREGRVVAELEVQFAAQHSAACKIVSGAESVQVGDVCSFTPAATPATPPGEPGPPAAAVPPPRPAGPGLWTRFRRADGRVLSQYVQSSGTGGIYRNPSLRADLRWNGTGREQLGVRLRGDRPQLESDVVGGLDRQSSVRLHELEVRWRSAAQKLEMHAGRLLAPRLELLGYMDGGGGRWQPVGGLAFGVAGGRGAELGREGFATGGDKLGGYIEGSWSGDARRARTLLGLGRVRDDELVRRQFGVLQSDIALGRRASAWQTLEVDVNPPWRRRLGEPHVVLTAASLTTHVQLPRRTALSLGFDTRRGLLQPEQRALAAPILPERTHAAHAAVSLRLGALYSLRLGGDVRFLPAGDGTARSWDANLYGARLGVRWLSGSVHAFGYHAERGRNLFGDVTLHARGGSWLQVDLAVGAGRIRTEPGIEGGAERLDRSGWVRLGTDLWVGRGVFLGASTEWRAHGDGDELAVELGRSF